MSTTKKNKYSVKKSSGVESTKLLKTLQKAIITGEASVSYVFVEERIKNIHAFKLSDMESYKTTCMLHVNLPQESLEKKTPNQIIEMLETTKNDLGADYFILS